MNTDLSVCFHLGGLGFRSHWAEADPRVAELCRRSATTAFLDLNQDQQIEALWRENARLKGWLQALVGLLAERGMLADEEARPLLAELQQEAPRPDPFNILDDEEKPAEVEEAEELTELAQAVEERRCGRRPAYPMEPADFIAPE